MKNDRRSLTFRQLFLNIIFHFIAVILVLPSQQQVVTFSHFHLLEFSIIPLRLFIIDHFFPRVKAHL